MTGMTAMIATQGRESTCEMTRLMLRRKKMAYMRSFPVEAKHVNSGYGLDCSSSGGPETLNLRPELQTFNHQTIICVEVKGKVTAFTCE